MASQRKFYKTVIEITVLSEYPYSASPPSLEAISEDITFGDCSGSWDVKNCVEVDGATMADLLLKQASDPSFFRLTDTGEDLEEA